MQVIKKHKKEWLVQLTRRGEYNIRNSELHPMLDWCTEQFGQGGRNRTRQWRYGWTNVYETFYFKRPEDATWFALKWG